MKTFKSWLVCWLGLTANEAVDLPSWNVVLHIITVSNYKAIFKTQTEATTKTNGYTFW